MQTQYQVGQLRKAAAYVGYEYHDPHSQTVPLIPDSWPCSCSLLGLCPRCKEQWVIGNPIPTTLYDASGSWGKEGAERNIHMFSVQLPDTCCRIF